MKGYIISPEALSKLLGKTDTEVTELLSKDGKQLEVEKTDSIIIEAMASKISSKVDDVKEVRGRARREVLSEVNKELLAIGATGENWKDQINSLIDKGSQAEIKQSDILNSQFFKDAVQKLKADLETEQEAHNKTKLEFSKKEESRVFNAFASSFIDNPENGFLIPENQLRAETLKRNFFRDLLDGDKRLSVVDGQTIVVDKDGNKAQDASFNVLTPEQFVKDTALAYFDQKIVDQKETPIIPSGTSGTSGFPTMKSSSDYAKVVGDWLKAGKTIEEMEALQTHFKTNIEPKLGS